LFHSFDRSSVNIRLHKKPGRAKKLNRYYIGYTNDLEKRLLRHNAALGKYTKRGIPWVLVYTEAFPSKSDAIKREREIKKMKSRKYIQELLNK